MPAGKPLQPFAPPQTDLLAFLPEGVTTGTVLTWLLYLVFAYWAIYTVVAIYHWLKYSHASWLAFPAISLHLFVSLSLMSYTLLGTFSL